MYPALGFLILLVSAVVWLISRPLWSKLGGWVYNQTEEITETLKEEHEVSRGVKGEDKDERNAECKKEN